MTHSYLIFSFQYCYFYKKKKVNFSQKKKFTETPLCLLWGHLFTLPHKGSFVSTQTLAFAVPLQNRKVLEGLPWTIIGIFAVPWSPRPEEVLDRGLHQLMQGSSPVQSIEKSFGFISQRRTSISSNHMSPPSVRGSACFWLAAVVYTVHGNQSNNHSRHLQLSTVCQVLCWGSIPRISLHVHNNLKRRALVPT